MTPSTSPQPGTRRFGPLIRVLRGAYQGVLTVAAIAGAACLAVLSAQLLFGVSPLVVTSGSMSPAIDAGSLVFVQERPAASVEPGDIVTVPVDGHSLTHRVQDVTAAADGRYGLTLKGDANPTSDPAPVTVETVESVLASVPVAGFIVAWLAQPLVLGSLLALLLGGAALFPPRALRATIFSARRARRDRLDRRDRDAGDGARSGAARPGKVRSLRRRIATVGVGALATALVAGSATGVPATFAARSATSVLTGTMEAANLDPVLAPVSTGSSGQCTASSPTIIVPNSTLTVRWQRPPGLTVSNYTRTLVVWKPDGTFHASIPGGNSSSATSWQAGDEIPLTGFLVPWTSADWRIPDGTGRYKAAMFVKLVGSSTQTGWETEPRYTYRGVNVGMKVAEWELANASGFAWMRYECLPYTDPGLPVPATPVELEGSTFESVQHLRASLDEQTAATEPTSPQPVAPQPASPQPTAPAAGEPPREAAAEQPSSDAGSAGDTEEE